MKFELTKETTFQGIYLWVKVDGRTSGPGKCFIDSDREKAEIYLQQLIDYYQAHGNLDNVTETLISKEVTYNPRA